MALTSKTKSLLSAAAKKPAAKGLSYSDGPAVATATKWLRLHRALKEQEGEILGVRAGLIEAVKPWHGEECERLGSYQPSVVVQTAEGGVQVQFQRKFPAIAEEREEELRAELGKEFDTLIGERVVMELRDEVARDPDQVNIVVRALATALGSDKFAAWFQCERTLVVRKECVEELVLDAKKQQLLGLTQTVVVGEKLAA